jgi:hypothetical protein
MVTGRSDTRRVWDHISDTTLEFVKKRKVMICSTGRTQIDKSTVVYVVLLRVLRALLVTKSQR